MNTLINDCVVFEWDKARKHNQDYAQQIPAYMPALPPPTRRDENDGEDF